MTPRGPEVHEATLGGERIERKIPGLGMHALHPLALEGEADQQRPTPVQALAAKAECAVVETEPHAEAPAAAVDADQRYDDQVEPARPQLPVRTPGRRVRHGDAEGASAG